MSLTDIKRAYWAFLSTFMINFALPLRLRSTMDSIRVSEAPDSGSIPDEATNASVKLAFFYPCYSIPAVAME
jgi:hypothetical protein